LRHLAKSLAAVALVSALSSTTAFASPISFTTTLVGDPRPDSPDNLVVTVSVAQDAANLRVTYWTVDLDMALYPKARLDEFGFSLVAPDSQYTFSDFNLPYTPVTGSLNGSGGAKFLLTLDDPNGNKYDATNVFSLRFTLTKTSDFTMADFTSAIPSCSDDTILGCNQLAAHLQAVGPTGNDSGVAIGNYPGSGNPVPEPASMLLFGTGTVASWLARRRRNAAA